jgi:hypothetical protein
MTQFSDLVGEHLFNIVPTKARHPFSNEADGVCFCLDDRTYLVFEDPDDGYRSTAGPILSWEGGAYALGYDGHSFPDYIRETVICSHRTKGSYGNEDNVLEVRSKTTGKLIFEVGTEDVDDYYPCFVNRWHPEGLKANAASAGEAGTAKTEGLGPKDEHAAPEGGDAQ